MTIAIVVGPCLGLIPISSPKNTQLK